MEGIWNRENSVAYDGYCVRCSVFLIEILCLFRHLATLEVKNAILWDHQMDLAEKISWVF